MSKSTPLLLRMAEVLTNFHFANTENGNAKLKIKKSQSKHTARLEYHPKLLCWANSKPERITPAVQSSKNGRCSKLRLRIVTAGISTLTFLNKSNAKGTLVTIIVHAKHNENARGKVKFFITVF